MKSVQWLHCLHEHSLFWFKIPLHRPIDAHPWTTHVHQNDVVQYTVQWTVNPRPSPPKLSFESFGDLFPASQRFSSSCSVEVIYFSCGVFSIFETKRFGILAARLYHLLLGFILSECCRRCITNSVSKVYNHTPDKMGKGVCQLWVVIEMSDQKANILHNSIT